MRHARLRLLVDAPFPAGFRAVSSTRRATMKVDGQNPECGICQLNRSMSEAGEIIWENKHW